MKYEVYVLRDEVEGIYFEPQLFRNEETAKRYFKDLCSKPGTKIGEHPTDFLLYKTGEYNDETGIIKADPDTTFIERGSHGRNKDTL